MDADVVGSTALGERLDAEEVRLVVGEAIARMVAAVEALGGTVKDLAGDGILALFGAPVAHEDDAERAVRAGLRIAEEMADYGSEVAKGWGIDGFAVRVGVNTGSVVLGPVGGGSRVEYGATGDPINTAARFQKAAAPGTVLVGESTYQLVETLFDWEGPEQFEVKGKQDAVTAYTATGVRAVPGRARGVLGVETPFVGRDEQLAAAREAADAVLGGTGGILFITGEAGNRQEQAQRRGAQARRSRRVTARSARSGSRAVVCRTASLSPTGPTATCSANGSASRSRNPSCGCASRCVAKSSASSASGCSRSTRISAPCSA